MVLASGLGLLESCMFSGFWPEADTVMRVWLMTVPDFCDGPLIRQFATQLLRRGNPLAAFHLCQSQIIRAKITPQDRFHLELLACVARVQSEELARDKSVQTVFTRWHEWALRREKDEVRLGKLIQTAREGFQKLKDPNESDREALRAVEALLPSSE